MASSVPERSTTWTSSCARSVASRSSNGSATAPATATAVDSRTARRPGPARRAATRAAAV
ncbi:hypothetical protein ACWEJP_18735 [Streptomyces sp. NPDC004749]